VSTTCLGGSLGALSVNLPDGTWKAFWLYDALPLLAVAAGISYLMLRWFSNSGKRTTAKEVLRDLPDPKKAR
jgi:hypothetical protein